MPSEYFAFAASFESLDSSIYNPETQLSTDDEKSENDEEVISQNQNPKEFGFSARMIQLIIWFGLTASFPNLYLAFRGMCTIPATSASAERKFSKVKRTLYYLPRVSL